MAGSFQLENKAYLTIAINGTEIASSWNLFNKLTLIHGFGLPIPQMQLILNDQHGYLTGDLAVNDGTRITVNLGKNADLAREVNFVVYGIKHHNDNNSNLIVLNCVLDAPKFTMEAARDKKRGTSIDALKDIAGKSDLEFASDLSTNDSMVWINCGEPRHVYTQRIADHCWNGNQTCVMAIPTFHKELVVQDCFEKLGEDPKVTLCYSFDDASNDVEGNPITTLEVAPVTLSGALNSWSNYGQLHAQHSLSGEDKVYEKANPMVYGDGLPLNKDLKSELEGSQIGWGGFFDVGCDGDVSAYNLHKNYYEADYMNTRHKALFTEGLRASIDTFTDLQIFDTVKYIQTDNLDAQDQINPRYEGKYILGGQTIIVEGHHYVEVLDLYRSFIEESGQTNVVGGSSSAGNGASSPIANQVPVNTSGGAETMLDVPASGGSSSQSPLSSIGGSDVQKPSNLQPDNTFAPQVASSLDKADDLKKQGDANDDSLIDVTAAKFQDIKSQAADRFKKAGSAYKTPALLEKYGEDADFLDATMREFSRAKDLMSMCDLLGDCELLSLEMAQLKTPAILDELESRADWLEGKLAEMGKDVNDLIANGNLDEQSMSAPSTSLECMDMGESAINDAIDGVYPDKCMARVTWDKLQVPQLELSQMIDKIKDFIRDLLCSLGEEADAAADGQEVGSSVGELVDAVKATGADIVQDTGKSVDSVKEFGANVQ